MAWSWTPSRRSDPELMDEPGLPEEEVAEAYRTLQRVNRQLGNLRSLRHELRRFLNEEGPVAQGVSVLDVGSGSGDLPRALRDEFARRQLDSTIVSLDRDPLATRLARRGGLDVVRGNALLLPLAAASIDLVTAIKFAHHFQGEALVRLISEMARVASRRVVILDIRRHWLAYWGFIAWSRVWTRNRLVRYDGPLSVLRGFTAEELINATTGVSHFRWSVRTYAGFQLALIGTRIAGSGTGRG